MRGWAVVDYSVCDPRKCSSEHGGCLAVQHCKREVLEQESPEEMPVLIFRDYCRGCADCVKACPLQAIKMMDEG